MRSVGVGSGGLRMSTSLVDATSPETGGDVYVTRGTCRYDSPKVLTCSLRDVTCFHNNLYCSLSIPFYLVSDPLG